MGIPYSAAIGGTFLISAAASYAFGTPDVDPVIKIGAASAVGAFTAAAGFVGARAFGNNFYTMVLAAGLAYYGADNVADDVLTRSEYVQPKVHATQPG